MLTLYRLLTFLLHPLVVLHLRCRMRKGKEDPARWHERLGLSPSAPKEGRWVWMHAASVGESLSILPLLRALIAAHPTHSFLVTTGTVTSAKLMAERLPAGAVHRYAPVDTPQSVKRFFDHWKPEAAIWVESELWPNMISEARARNVRLGLVNGRMSERSAQRWERFSGPIKALLYSFRVVLAQSEADLARFRRLGADAACLGNLKYDAATLPCDDAALAKLRQAARARPVWLAASTHPGEEELMIAAHARVRETYPDALMVLIPRHPSRGAEIAAMLAEKELRFCMRSKGELPTADTQCYLADTLGEVGVFYALSPMTFLGGSLVPVGGHNPLEPALLNCALLLGPHTFNFSQILEDLTSKGAVTVVHDAPELAAAVVLWLGQDALAKRQASIAFEAVKAHQGVAVRVAQALKTVIA